MAYNQNIPIATDDLSVSQPQIQANFFAIYGAFNLNHVPFNTPDGTEGKHMFVEMPNQNASPPTTIAGEVGLYCNTSTYTTQPELFFIKQNGTTAPSPLNGANGYEVTSSNYIANGGWTRLPSGIMLQWGNMTVSGANNPIQVPLPISGTIPNFYTIYQVLISSQSYNGTMGNYVPVPISILGFVQPTNSPSPVVAGSFGIVSTQSNVTFRYLAIGI